MTKYHHHYPVTLLRRWANAEERVWYYNIKFGNAESGTSEPRLTKIYNIFGENHANTFVDLDGTANDEVERKLSKFESDVYLVAGEVERFSSAPQSHSISAECLHRLHLLYWNLSIRSPAFRREHAFDQTEYEKVISKPVRELMKAGVEFSSDDLEYLNNPQAVKRLSNFLDVNSIASIWSHPSPRVFSMGFQLLVPKRSSSTFAVGPNANVRIMLEGPREDAILIIAPRVALTPYGLNDQILVRECDDRIVRKINLEIYSQNGEIVARDRQLLQSL